MIPGTHLSPREILHYVGLGLLEPNRDNLLDLVKVLRDECQESLDKQYHDMQWDIDQLEDKLQKIRDVA